jgi:hypothetical protein
MRCLSFKSLKLAGSKHFKIAEKTEKTEKTEKKTEITEKNGENERYGTTRETTQKK